MKSILCFGDSNTWGYSPVDGRRYNENERWPALLTSLLPLGCRIIEQGQPGRTTFFDDPAAGLVNGNDDLVPCLQKHQPDYIVLMLGTNDLKSSFAQSADDISRNTAKLVLKIQQHSTQNIQKAPAICLVAPPVIYEVGYFGQLFAGGAQKSKQFARYYALRANELGCEFFDAGSVVNSSSIDGIHWEADQHRKMADQISIKLKAMLLSCSHTGHNNE
ncbi:SGNH/GDSL hydrolase family protein [Psychromonas ossibalaenae]|uniref:SGNH/GDSL hydrolase family protein n=1 Tax=Psychromonas ossibalaenae TaxID=444922 RepID=UPI0003822E65|nr:SGNH/GDSL hydrolase family protein [Psychromonas ossibalaenae]